MEALIDPKKRATAMYRAQISENFQLRLAKVMENLGAEWLNKEKSDQADLLNGVGEGLGSGLFAPIIFNITLAMVFRETAKALKLTGLEHHLCTEQNDIISELARCRIDEKTIILALAFLDIVAEKLDEIAG